MKEFNFNADIPYDKNRYVLMEDNSILEVGRDSNTESPFELGLCAGNYGSGDYDIPAYRDAWEKMSSNTIDAIENRVAAFLMEHMQIENGLNLNYETRDENGNELPEGEEVLLVAFPDVIDLINVRTELNEDDFKSIVTDKDANRLLTLIQEDFYDPFCGPDGKFSPKEMIEFCKNNDINISDIALVATVNLDRSNVAVVFIEANSFNEYSGIELKDATQEQKDNVLKESVDMLNTWNDNEVYQWTLYDKHGDEIESGGGYYGEDMIKDAVETFADGYDVSPVKDLGTHKDIANCLYANKNTLSHNR